MKSKLTFCITALTCFLPLRLIFLFTFLSMLKKSSRFSKNILCSKQLQKVQQNSTFFIIPLEICELFLVIKNKIIRSCKIQNKQTSYFNYSSKMYMAVQCMSHHTFSSTIPTQQQETGIYLFSPTTFPSPSTSSLQFLSQFGYINSHLEDETEDEDSQNQTMQKKTGNRRTELG